MTSEASSDQFFLLEEPLLLFGEEQLADDPHDGLALFGPAESASGMPDHVAIGTTPGLELWRAWCQAFNRPAACDDPARHRPWPPFPGYDVAFGATWPQPIREYGLDAPLLSRLASKADKYERAYAVANAYLEPIAIRVARLDAKPAVAICIVPDEVYRNCRPQSYVSEPSDQRKTPEERSELRHALVDRKSGQESLSFIQTPENIEQYGLSPDFRRQLKARVMEHELPIQLVRESTLTITEQVRAGLPGVNPLSDRLWNLGTGLFYKCGRKPWTTPWARDGVCYVGIAFRKDERDNTNACCAAQLFLDSGDGIVFVGEFGPWYSAEKGEFHLTADAAERLLRGTIETHARQEGRELREIFLHSRSGFTDDEFRGFRRATPTGVRLVGIRVRRDPLAPRLFRHDDNPKAADRGKYPVLRGTFWKRTRRHGYLFTSGFKPRIASYDGFEVPVPLTITIQQGDADLVQVARDILGLTKLNYNSCTLGDGQPITIKYSDMLGEVLLANHEIPSAHWQYNFKYYI